MLHKDRLWHLLAGYFTGEATDDELKELQEIVNNDTALNDAIQILHEFWKKETGGNLQEIENAWSRHVKKIK